MPPEADYKKKINELDLYVTKLATSHDYTEEAVAELKQDIDEAYHEIEAVKRENVELRTELKNLKESFMEYKTERERNTSRVIAITAIIVSLLMGLLSVGANLLVNIYLKK